jgi:hypothetical protein
MEDATIDFVVTTLLIALVGLGAVLRWGRRFLTSCRSIG